ncbi:beta-propeller domain-containing protein [Nocardioides taihuensis]|uniref:Beta-propeller domain-containing protein n=1 Tax=Nocardioides taihuensis TaxID=1835606 RepID=A0ABW0BHZ9_9ACTN
MARPLLTRPLTSAVVLALAAAALAGGAVAARPGEDAAPAARTEAPAITAAAWDEALAPGSCADLLDHYVGLGMEQVGPWGWSSPYLGMYDGPTATLAAAEGDTATLARQALASGPHTSQAVASATGTTVQEAGVDEPDQVKADGELLVRVRGATLTTYDVSAREPTELGSRALDLPGRHPELLLVGTRAVVLGSHTAPSGRASTAAVVVDLADPAEPSVASTSTYDTGLVSAVQHGSTVRLVLTTPLPDLDFVVPHGWRAPATRWAERRNREVVRSSTLDDWLPHVTTGSPDGTTQRLLGCDQVAVPGKDAGLGTLAVVGLDPAAPTTTSAQGIATGSDIAYVSTDRLYLATPPAPLGWGCCWRVTDAVGRGVTRLYSFSLDGPATTYTAAGEVAGTVADRWAMDEVDGVLRVAVGPSVGTGRANAVVTLAEEGDRLVELGHLGGLGRDEQIESVRWFDGLAVVVTYRQVDPLWTVDLSDPADPRLAGRLEIPGFSEYLHPFGPRRMLGVGQTGRGGAQAALFDVQDLAHVRRLHVVHYGPGTTAAAAGDPRQLTWLPRERQVLTVVSHGWRPRGVWVSQLTIDGGPVERRLVEVAHGPAAGVRLVPLPPTADDPDGPTRVVLVAGDEVSAFDY